MEASKRWHTTRGTLSPLYEQVRQGTTHARKDKHVPRKKWPVLIALLAAGATVGATGAVIARRRRAAAQWDEYEPLPAIDEPSYGAGISSASKKVTAGAASVADSVSNQAGKLAESLHEKSARTSPASPAGGSATSGGSTKSGGSASSGGSAASGGSPNTSSPSGAFAPFADEADEAATKANTKNTR
jgi:cytoskeletal protein RodZ